MHRREGGILKRIDTDAALGCITGKVYGLRYLQAMGVQELRLQAVCAMLADLYRQIEEKSEDEEDGTGEAIHGHMPFLWRSGDTRRR